MPLSRLLRSRCRTPTGVLALFGGAAVAVGSCLPWMSLFAGLRPLHGLIGLNGRLLLVAGAIGMTLGIALLRRGERRVLLRLSAGLGATVSAAAVWLLVGVWQLTHRSGRDALLAMRPGPGLVVVLFGGLLLVAAGARAALVRARPRLL